MIRSLITNPIIKPGINYLEIQLTKTQAHSLGTSTLESNQVIKSNPLFQCLIFTCTYILKYTQEKKKQKQFLKIANAIQSTHQLMFTVHYQPATGLHISFYPHNNHGYRAQFHKGEKLLTERLFVQGHTANTSCLLTTMLCWPFIACFNPFWLLQIWVDYIVLTATLWIDHINKKVINWKAELYWVKQNRIPIPTTNTSYSVCFMLINFFLCFFECL